VIFDEFVTMVVHVHLLRGRLQRAQHLHSARRTWQWTQQVQVGFPFKHLEQVLSPQVHIR